MDKLLETPPLVLALVALVLMAAGAAASVRILISRRNGHAEEVTIKLAKFVEDRVDHKYERFKELLDSTDERVEDHEDRIRLLESRKR